MTQTNMGWVVTSVATAITGSSALTTGSTNISSGINNVPAVASPTAYVWADLVLDLPNGLSATISVEQPVEVYIIPEIDGSNYLDWDNNFTDILAPQNLYRGAFMVRAESTASTAQRLGLMDVLMPPYNFKIGIRNNTGVSLQSTYTVQYVLKSFSFS